MNPAAPFTDLHRRAGAWPADDSPVARTAAAAGPLLLWLAGDAVRPLLSSSRVRLWLAADVSHLDLPGWGWLPLIAVTLSALWRARCSSDAPAWPRHLGQTWLRLAAAMAMPALLMSCLRLVSLWTPLTALFPWLTLLWSPHASVGLACVALVGWPATARADGEGERFRDPHVALLLFIGALFAYASYTLYFCQVTMLHGDEGQYLRVTQSLLRDGDMDLTNNLDDEHAAEFHVVPSGVAVAPGSPEGKAHSVHPIGLSVLLAPAYQLGLLVWANPRLGAALAMATVAATVVALLFLWLRHVDIARATALATVGVCATTIPLLLFSTQLYPETCAVVITLAVLLRLPPIPMRNPNEGNGVRQPWEFAVWVLLLGALPFLHPRYLPLAGLLGAGLLWQAWGQTRRRGCLLAIGVAAVVAGAMLLRHHLAFSGDWLGHFRPGNAWDENALDPATWLVSIPGHWLHQSKGLAINAPVFLVAAVPGLTALLHNRDRRWSLAAALYTTTAVANGVHPDWTFGFCLPARFLVTALPALALLVAIGFEHICRRRWLAPLLGASLLASWDTAWAATVLPERGYTGDHLLDTVLSRYYPFAAHGFTDAEAVPVADLAMWGAVIAALVAISLPNLRRRRPWAVAACLALAAVAPALWGYADIAERLQRTVSPYLRFPGASGAAPVVQKSTLEFYTSSTGQAEDDGVFRADESHHAGILAAYHLPVQLPGIYRLHGDGLAVGDVPQHAVISLRPTLPAMQDWERRHTTPLAPTAAGTYRIDYRVTDVGLGRVYFLFSGEGTLSLEAPRLDFHPRLLSEREQERSHYDFRHADDESDFVARDRLEPGHYRARYRVAGSALETLFERQPVPVRMAVLVVADGEPIDANLIGEWHAIRGGVHDLARMAIKPQTEALVAPWRTAALLAGDHFALDFHLSEPATAWFLYDYDGGADLHLAEVVLYRLYLEKGPP